MIYLFLQSILCAGLQALIGGITWKNVYKLLSWALFPCFSWHVNTVMASKRWTSCFYTLDKRFGRTERFYINLFYSFTFLQWLLLPRWGLVLTSRVVAHKQKYVCQDMPWMSYSQLNCTVLNKTLQVSFGPAHLEFSIEKWNWYLTKSLFIRVSGNSEDWKHFQIPLFSHRVLAFFFLLEISPLAVNQPDW